MVQNDDDIMEAMEGIEDITEEKVSVKSIAKLLDSEMVCRLFFMLCRWLFSPG